MSIKNKFNFVLLAAAAPLAFGLTGCSDADVAEAVGDIALAAIVVAAPPVTTCYGGDVEVCHSYTDYCGVVRTECHREYDSCAVRRVDSLSMGGVSPSLRLMDAGQAQVSATATADTFKMSYAASSVLIDALQRAKNKDLSAVLGLGLTRDDVMNLGADKLPSEAGIEALAKNLNQDVSATRAMLQKLIDVTVQQRQAKELEQISG